MPCHAMHMVEVLWDCIFHLIVMYTLLLAIVLSCLVLLIGTEYITSSKEFG